MKNELDKNQIIKLSKEASIDLKIEVVESTNSTNSELRFLLNNNTRPTLLVAKTQKNGRGRGKKKWFSDKKTGVCFSLAWPFLNNKKNLLGLPIVISVSVAKYLQNYNSKIGLKWPNDLLVDGKKLSGILTETFYSKNMNGFPTIWAIIGVGINLYPNSNRDLFVEKPTAFLTIKEININNLLAKLSDNLITDLKKFETDGLHSFIKIWDTMDIYKGKSIKIMENKKEIYRGTSLGINEFGELILKKNNEKKTINIGDVSLISQ